MTDRRYVLYRARAADGSLLYIGITLNPGTRFRAHSYRATWWQQATTITMEHLPDGTDRSAALAHEANAIRAERPIFNITGTRYLRSFSKSVEAFPGGIAALEAAIAQNADNRELSKGEARALVDEMHALVRRGYKEGNPVPELARLAGVTRGRIYQILSDQ